MHSVIKKHVKNVKLEFTDDDVRLVVIDDVPPKKPTFKCIIYNGRLYSALTINRNRIMGYDRIAKRKR